MKINICIYNNFYSHQKHIVLHADIYFNPTSLKHLPYLIPGSTVVRIRTFFPPPPGPPLLLVVIDDDDTGDELLAPRTLLCCPRLPCDERRAERAAIAERGKELRPSFTLNFTLNIIICIYLFYIICLYRQWVNCGPDVAGLCWVWVVCWGMSLIRTGTDEYRWYSALNGDGDLSVH